MNLLDALRSSRETNYYYSRPGKHLQLLLHWNSNGMHYPLTVEDMLAEDWEPVMVLPAPFGTPVNPSPVVVPILEPGLPGTIEPGLPGIIEPGLPGILDVTYVIT